MAHPTIRRLAAALWLGVALPGAALAQGTVPLSATVPGAATPAPLPEGADAPLPAERPETPVEQTETGAAPAADAPVPGADSGEVPAVATPPIPEPAPQAPSGAPAAPNAPAAPEGEPAAPASPDTAAPTPAYVPPEKARTTPEPSAPSTPAMEVTPAQTVEAAAAVEDAVLCEAELKQRGATFTVGETIADGDCGVLRPVALTRSSSGVSISPATQFLCRTALALDIWLAESVEPAAREHLDGAEVTALAQASTYVCRGRASESRISEHSRGSAVDIGGFTLKDGRTVAVEKPEPGTPEDRFAAAVRRAACGPFRTVIGPGTDPDHDTHLHLDIAARSNDSTYCR